MAAFEYVSNEAPEVKGAPKPPLDLSHHFSRVTLARDESSVKKFYQYFKIPGIANLAGGLPHASLFPFDTLEAQTAKPERWTPTANDPTDLSEQLQSTRLTKDRDVTASNHITVPHTSAAANLLKKIDLTTALQYGPSQGYPPLFSFLRQFSREVLHPNVPYAGGPEISLTVGNTDGMAKTVEAFTNVWSAGRDQICERPGLLCEHFAFLSAVQTVEPRGVQVVPVEMDEVGLAPTGPGGLEDVLENWDPARGLRPHLLYTVSIGQNPTGGTVSVQRRKEVYAICSKYDVIIIEDDPYWYLQYPTAPLQEAEARNLPIPIEPVHQFAKKSGYPFIDSLVPSYLSVDTDGRVVRLDTFSKTIAPGCRWRCDGWVRWLAGLRGVYERRMNRMCGNLEEGRFLLKQNTPLRAADSDWAIISKTEMYSFSWPRGGMFVWVQLHYENHPLAHVIPGSELSDALWVFLTRPPYLCLASVGAMFSPTDQIRNEEGWKYFRLCFSAVSEEELDKSSKSFAAGIKAFWLIKDKKALNDINDIQVDTETFAGELVNLTMMNAC
ncbi:aromatic amino acid aminotransferase [Diplocarpon rosae]|nr:aromatic amino acid aminotransferase [Diplocarpon rosae]